MARLKGLKLEYSRGSGEVSQSFDLEELTGAPVQEDPTLVREIGQAIIDYISNRVNENKGVGNKPLTSPYSKAYENSDAFKAAGKSSSNVNMRLTGDMLSSIDILQERGARITVGIAGDEAAKAYGHMTGFQGHPFLSGPKREFFGVTQDELKKEILPKFKSEIKDLRTNAREIETAQQENLIRNVTRASQLFSDLEDDDL